MYEELVKKLRNDNACLSNKTLHEAADAIDDLEFACNRYEKDYKDLCAYLTKWIPVTEQPPLKVGDDGYNGYLVYANGYYEVADYTTDKFDNVLCFHVNGEYEPDVTHYMPLPEPPKEETV